MIQSVQRAAQILGVLGSGTPRLGVTEIAERVGLAKPTVHGLLRTLAAHDLVAQDPDTGKYSLGPGRAAARQRLPGRVRAARQVAAVGGVAGPAGRRGGLGRHPVRVAGDRAAPRVPAGQHGADPRGRRGDPVARVRPRPRDRSVPARGTARQGAGRGTRPADRPDQDHAGRAVPGARPRSGSAATRWRTRRRPWATPGSRRPIVARDGVVAGAIGVVGAADRLLAAEDRDELVRAGAPRPARAVSRDLGAGRGGVVLSALAERATGHTAGYATGGITRSPHRPVPSRSRYRCPRSAARRRARAPRRR